jgi:hypothetical protein
MRLAASSLWVLTFFLCGSVATTGQEGNRGDRLEWFRDQGFGLFIHWGVDSQLARISHEQEEIPGMRDGSGKDEWERAGER